MLPAVNTYYSIITCLLFMCIMKWQPLQALMFPPSVYNYMTESLHKDMILVLNKIDLAPAPLVVAWKRYFQEKYPALHILTFTSFPTYNLRGNQENKAGMWLICDG